MALGGWVRVGMVKAVMRAIVTLQRQPLEHVIADSEDEGIRRLLKDAGPDTPAREIVEADLKALREMLARAGRASTG